MSRENVELMRRAFAAWNAGDMTALGELYDPAVVMYHLDGWPEPGPSVGRDAVMREWEQIREPWQEGDALELIGDWIDAGDHVVARYAWRASGSGPGALMDISQVTTFRNGRVITIQNFWDHAEALKAVGLRD
jgi:ketosteroid isomerase-like protein